jgi:SAM-dependent methyltransferase
MAYDHSQTYRRFRLRNLPHILRIRRIMGTLDRMTAGTVPASYADFGCSTGYLTMQVAKRLGAQGVFGFDHSQEHVATARQTYPDATFARLDLNAPRTDAQVFDFVTCFETLEHVGDLDQAVQTVVGAIAPGGQGLIVVPIESRRRGYLKYLIKTRIYGYNTDELSQEPGFADRYRAALARGDRISRFRQPPRDHWGTHFGFDTRDVDDILSATGLDFDAFDTGFNRFYRVRK